MMKVMVLGAGGGIGGAIVRELAARGHDVTAVSRRGDALVPDGVSARAADLADRAQAIAACDGADVVVMAAHIPYDRWATELEALFDNALAGAEAAGSRFVLVDNLYAYGSSERPIGTATSEAATSRKGALRRRLAARLLDAHRSGRVPVTIGRFSDYYGPGGTNSLLYKLAINPALAGKRMRAYIDADQPHTFHYLPDAARGFATLVERPEADGQAWVLPAAPPVTQRALLTMIADELGVPARFGKVTRAQLAVAGLANPLLREARELTDQWTKPYVTDASAFEEAFGTIPTTPHRQAVAETVAALRADAPRRTTAGQQRDRSRRRGKRGRRLVVAGLALAVTTLGAGIVADVMAFDPTSGGYEPPYTDFTGEPIDWDAATETTDRGMRGSGYVLNFNVDCTTGMISVDVFGIGNIDFRPLSERALAVHAPREACEARGFTPAF